MSYRGDRLANEVIAKRGERAEVARMLAGSAGNAITRLGDDERDGSEAVVAVAELVYTARAARAKSEWW